ncbi:MAG: nitroreductase family protein [Porticoccus sp.]|nr:nitroreductase family protein [Porticoccus sp.]
MTSQRTSDYPIEPIFLNRWSPRAYDASSMPAFDLLTILEAARWAPSAFNIQPWRFLYSYRDDAYWQKYLTLLDSFNASWAQQASALVFVLSNTVTPGDSSRPEKLSRTHSFDAGAAWAQLALQATSLGYQAHAMAGIHFEQVQEKLLVPDFYRIEIAVAIGKRAEPSVLPEALQDREQPSQRLLVSEIASAGTFPQ